MRPALTVCLAAASCASSDQKLVDKATSFATYYTASYEHKCHPGDTANPCASCRASINKGEWQIKTANQIVKLGLTPQERQELADLIVELQRCP